MTNTAYLPPPRCPAALVEPRPLASSDVAGAANVATALVAVRACYPIVSRLVIGLLAGLLSTAHSTTASRKSPDALWAAVRQIDDAALILVSVAALVAYLVWFARAYAAVRARSGVTRFSNGLAVGGWFVPVLNLFVPYLALRDAVRRGDDDRRGRLVALWWTTWLFARALAFAKGTFVAAIEAQRLHFLDVRVINAIGPLLDGANEIANLTSGVALVAVIESLTRALGRKR
jgi:hypothetical protein